MRADLIAAGLQSGWKDLTYAAAEAAWGHAIDVPDNILKTFRRLSAGSPVSVANLEYPARMSTPDRKSVV